MKTKTYIIFTIISIITISCSSLDLNPVSQASSETWFLNEDEVQMSVNRLFNIDFWIDIQFLGSFPKDASTDNWTQRSGVTEINSATINGQTSYVCDIWKKAYQNIAASNLIINKLKDNTDLSKEKILRYEAIARFSRACMYSKLIFLYGNVPFYTEPIQSDELYDLERTSTKDILPEIYNDFNFAISNLPTEYNSNEYKYVTKGAALAMKARIALYMGDYNTARDAALACMNLNLYKLYPDYQELFLPETKNTEETIFCIPRSVEQDIIYPWWTLVWQTSRIYGGNNNGGPSWDLFCSYLCKDGLPIDESSLFDPHNPFKNRDPRLTATIVEFGSEHMGLIYQPHPDSLTVLNVKNGTRVRNRDSRGVDQYASYNGLMINKGMDESCLTRQIDPDQVVIRYADVLLIYAEAKIELNEIDESVLNAMNGVRARAYSHEPSYPPITTTVQDKLRKILRIERRMEFAWEGTRYEDLIRWHQAEKVLNTPIYGMLDPEELREKIVNKGEWFFPETPKIDDDYNPDFTDLYEKGYAKLLVNRKFDKNRQYLWPIPSTEIQICPNIQQNPGY